jgi:C-terminal processing protease CtpA/Prc
MTMRRRVCAWHAVLAALLVVPPALAADPRLEQEVDEMLLRLIDRGVLGPRRPDKAIVLEREARVRYELGAVVSRPRGGATDALEVLALTPGGRAEAMGLHVGDRILRINGVELARSPDPGADMAVALHRREGRLHVELLRGERRMQVEGRAEAIPIPGFRLVIDRPEPRAPGSRIVE